MTIEQDEIALRNLMARYVDAVNRRDVDAWTKTWAEDGSWNLLGTEVSGRNNIVGLWQQMMAGFEFALMMPSSCLFEIAGDRASGHWYVQEYTRDLEGNSGNVLGHYQDNYRREGDQWLYQSRRYNFLYHGPADLSGTYTPLA